MVLLCRKASQQGGVAALPVFDLTTALAVFRVETVAQDRIQPRDHVRTRHERIDVGKGFYQSFLDKIVGAFTAPAQAVSICPQFWQGFQEVAFWFSSRKAR